MCVGSHLLSGGVRYVATTGAKDTGGFPSKCSDFLVLGYLSGRALRDTEKNLAALLRHRADTEPFAEEEPLWATISSPAYVSQGDNLMFMNQLRRVRGYFGVGSDGAEESICDVRSLSWQMHWTDLAIMSFRKYLTLEVVPASDSVHSGGTSRSYCGDYFPVLKNAYSYVA